MQQQMVKVSLEVRSGAARFRVGVRAENIRKALSGVEGRYPKSEVKLVLPITPEDFLGREPSVLAGTVGSERAHRQAA